MKLKKLFKEIPGAEIKGSKDLEISGLSANSKLVSPGNLFIAKKGFVDDGAKYIREAISGGAYAVLTDMYDPSLKEITQIVHPKVNAIEGFVAAEYYGNPSKDLFMVGITGTNGKTTTSFLVKSLLDSLSGLSGLIGTIEYIVGPHRYMATRTTPDVVSNHKMLREMVLQGCSSAVMEVTSHAIDQGRVASIDFDVAVFTNLSIDHLDYHGTMEKYAATKALLFKNLGKEKLQKPQKFTKTAVINIDSPWAERIVQECSSKVITYGLLSDADVKATDISLNGTGSYFNLHYKGQVIPCQTTLVGRFNIYNVLAAIAVAISRGFTLEKIVAALSKFFSVPGRLEAVLNPLGLKIYVDFAHSDDALENVLQTLSEFKTGKIITVFGCGGDRDVSKRPLMAEKAEKYSDFTIVTADNPRSEAPEEICRQIALGFKKTDSFTIELDRRAAIEKAIKMATPDDLILIAGKGHEPYQIFAHKTVEFDDRKVALDVCQKQLVKR